MTGEYLGLTGRGLALVGKADPVDDIDDDVRDLAKRMAVTLRRLAGRGLALAAPQVGVPVALVVTANGQVLCNPAVEARGQLVTDLEGCLSLPGRWYAVERHSAVTVHAVDHDGRAVAFDEYGMFARIYQHELDHLDGVLISDRWPEIKRPRL